MTTQSYQDAYAAAWKALARKENQKPGLPNMQGRGPSSEYLAKKKAAAAKVRSEVLAIIRENPGIMRAEIVDAMEGLAKYNSVRNAILLLHQQGRYKWVAV